MSMMETPVPRGNAYGWHRRHTPSPATELSGIGDIPTRTFPNLPPQAAQQAVDSVNKVHAHYGSNAAAAVAAVLARQNPNMAPQAVASLQAFLARQGVSGLSGVGYFDANGDWQPDESPYPVIFDSGPGTASYPAGSSPPIDWASIISSSTQSLANILAITQGGSVTQTGVYGSQQTGNIAAGAYPANSLNVSGSGVSGFLSSPMVLLMVGAVVLIMVSKK